MIIIMNKCYLFTANFRILALTQSFRIERYIFRIERYINVHMDGHGQPPVVSWFR